MRLFLRILLLPVVLGAILFGAAGRLDLPFMWAYIAMMVMLMGAAWCVVDRELLAERMHPAPGGVDRNLRLWCMPPFLAFLVIAGLDAGRFQWSGHIPTWLRICALAGCALFLGLSLWAIAVNRFFSPVVRIQSERQHHLITDGPYRWIRHPGYIAALLGMPCGGIALGSWWSLLAMVPMGALIIRRTVIEDRFLHEHLEGYAAYAVGVRYRLIPLVW